MGALTKWLPQHKRLLTRISFSRRQIDEVSSVILQNGLHYSFFWIDGHTTEQSTELLFFFKNANVGSKSIFGNEDDIGVSLFSMPGQIAWMEVCVQTVFSSC